MVTFQIENPQRLRENVLCEIKICTCCMYNKTKIEKKHQYFGLLAVLYSLIFIYFYLLSKGYTALYNIFLGYIE